MSDNLVQTVVLLLIAGGVGMLLTYLGEKLKNTPKSIGDKRWPLGISRNFLTAAEQSFMGVLRTSVSDRAIICPKVRLADIVFIEKGTSNKERMAVFNRISQKHLDFVLIHPTNMQPLCAVELDDKSHRSASAQKRDEVKEKALKDAGLPLVRIPMKSAYTLQALAAAFVAAGVDLDKDEKQTDEIKTVSTLEYEGPPFCPNCHVAMVERTAKRGEHCGETFYGCPNYPHCRETMPLISNDFK